jgi:lantibiotic leader peptide-processing serine protease
MRRSAWFLTLVPLALAACAADQKVVAPSASSTRAVQSAGASNAGRYIVASNSGFKGDLAKTIADLGGTLESIHQGAGIAVVSGLTEVAASQLNGRAGINDVEADFEFAVGQGPRFETDMSAVEPQINSQANPATAGRYPWQWNMRLIQADKAWAAGKLGSSTVTVAILDSGIDYDAPDLVGLVDLSRSKSFVASDDSLTAKYFPTRNRISDYNGHGTNVATQVSSKAVALAGVTSKTTLMGVKVLSRTGAGSSSSTINGLLWAADHGADVANMSLGSPGNLRRNITGFIGLMNRVFNYAKTKGMVIVVSAGNESTDFDHDGNGIGIYCDAPHVICVSAVGPRIASDLTPLANGAQNPLSDSPAFYTNYGRQALDIAAPGGNALPKDSTLTVSKWLWGDDVASWVWSYCTKTRIASVDSTTGVPALTACAAGNRLSGYIGTSQASPHVAGLAALLVAEYGRNHPEKVKQMIQKSADNVNPLLGRGRINVLHALEQ